MVIMNGQDAKNMYSCRVLYIGSAPPTETLKGVEALQEPLRQRFPADVNNVEGIDATLRVLPDALEITYIESGQVLHFPLSRMSVCAGVTAVNVSDGSTGEKSRQFVPVNTIKHLNSTSPAIFAAIIRRSQGRQIAECHMFICNSTRDALHLVNAAATANMALKQQRKTHRIASTGHTGYENDVVIVKTGVIDAPQNGHVVNGGHAYGRSEETVAQSDVNTTIGQRHYQIQTSDNRAPSPETIYISFDKTNLITKGDNVLEVKSRQRSPSPRPSPRAFEDTSAYSYRPIAPPPPPQPQPVMVARPLPVPPPRPVFVRAPPPQPILVRGPPPQPIMVRAPPPRPVLMRAPPRPIVVQARPPQPVIVRSPPPPPPQRLYTRRTVTVPPPQRYASPAPLYVRSRARSVSPVRGYAESRMSRKGELYQPKWEGEAKRPASDSGFRMSRRDQFDYQSPPRDFRQSQNMYLNERAFSRRVYADDRISQMSPGYQYPNAYDFNNIMMYDRPTTKSNPRYSSSSDSDDGKDNRMSKSYRR